MNLENGRKPQKLHICWELATPTDEMTESPEDKDEGFWPSRDPHAAGYVEPSSFESAMAEALDRKERWESGEWEYVGVVAVANLLIPIGGDSFRIMTLKSGGLWGIESDCTDYIREVFEEQKGDLLAELKTLGEALASGDYIQEDAEKGGDLSVV